MDMWQFFNNEPPINNYVMWFIMALFFNWSIVKFKVNSHSRSARWLFYSQLSFFVIIVFHHTFFLNDTSQP